MKYVERKAMMSTFMRTLRKERGEIGSVPQEFVKAPSQDLREAALLSRDFREPLGLTKHPGVVIIDPF